jgi:hypothetical protein
MTFQELKQRVAELTNRKAVLIMVMEYIDAEFRTIGGSSPKKAIKTDEGNIVPETVLETTSAQFANEIRDIDQQIAGILNTDLQPAPPVQAQQGE